MILIKLGINIRINSFMTTSWQFHSILQKACGSLPKNFINTSTTYVGQSTCIKMFISHRDIRDPERFSYLPMVTQQVSDQRGLGPIQVVMKLKCFGSERIVQPKDVGPKMGSTA